MAEEINGISQIMTNLRVSQDFSREDLRAPDVVSDEESVANDGHCYHSSHGDAVDCNENAQEYQHGSIVQVLSRSAGGWTEGCVVNAVWPGRITVEFPVTNEGKMLCRKHMWPTSRKLCMLHEEYDPGFSYATQQEATDALNDFVITFPEIQISGGLAEVMALQHVGNNAFTSRCSNDPKCGMFNFPFYISHRLKPKERECVVDKVLKVHALSVSEPYDEKRYKPVGPRGFVHTLIHKEGEEEYFNPYYGRHAITGAFYLGFTVNKNLSTDLRATMLENKNGNRAYWEGLFERFKETWDARGDQQAEILAEHADFLISYTGHDKVENDKVLAWLAAHAISGPHTDPLNKDDKQIIKFCTDRSLGFGVHFYSRHGGVENEDAFTLKLGKHGFAQPVDGGSWWDEYRQAAVGRDGHAKGSGATKLGILVLSLTENYFKSKACIKEYTEIPVYRVWVRQSLTEGHKIISLLHAIREREDSYAARRVLVDAFRNPHKFQELVEALQDGSRAIRITAVHWIVEVAASLKSIEVSMPGFSAIQQLVNSDIEPGVRSEAVLAVSRLAIVMKREDIAFQTFDALMQKVLEDDDYYVNTYAMRAIGNLVAGMNLEELSMKALTALMLMVQLHNSDRRQLAVETLPIVALHSHRQDTIAKVNSMLQDIILNNPNHDHYDNEDIDSSGVKPTAVDALVELAVNSGKVEMLKDVLSFLEELLRKEYFFFARVRAVLGIARVVSGSASKTGNDPPADLPEVLWVRTVAGWPELLQKSLSVLEKVLEDDDDIVVREVAAERIASVALCSQNCDLVWNAYSAIEKAASRETYVYGLHKALEQLGIWWDENQDDMDWEEEEEEDKEEEESEEDP
mmetsp:Transcript_7021/g.12073  ORF Transcript_7021/g.12073 Transcript_7021/m.12073 type:complete len:858 (-) Transcript_7021:114-2687(-)